MLWILLIAGALGTFLGLIDSICSIKEWDWDWFWIWMGESSKENYEIYIPTGTIFRTFNLDSQ